MLKPAEARLGVARESKLLPAAVAVLAPRGKPTVGGVLSSNTAADLPGVPREDSPAACEGAEKWKGVAPAVDAAAAALPGVTRPKSEGWEATGGLNAYSSASSVAEASAAAATSGVALEAADGLNKN